MRSLENQFVNVIACEDVREEIGNKKSLMGVFSGNIVAAEIPAQVWIAFYIEKMPEQPGKAEEVVIQVKQNERTVGTVTINFEAPEIATLVIPRAVMRIPEECTLILTASVNRGEPIQILSKSVSKGDIQRP